MRAKHTTFHGFTNIYALWTVKEQNTEMPPNPPVHLLPLGFVPGPLCPSLMDLLACSLRAHQR